jgi:sec-independent protein translocase protein TatC
MALMIIISITLGVTFIDVNGLKIPILFPNSFDNIAVQIIFLLNSNLIPNNVNLVQTSPGQAFTAQMYVAIIIGLLGSLPLILREFMAFLNPALFHNERRVVKRTIIPAIILFVLGCWFAYSVAIPYTLEFLYKYGQAMDILTFFDVTSFMMFVLNFLVIFGLSFELPLIMWATSKSNLVTINFWSQNMKYIIILIVILGAFITPDGSGVTMWFISGPLIVLYLVGLIILKNSSKNNFTIKQVQST